MITTSSYSDARDLADLSGLRSRLEGGSLAPAEAPKEPEMTWKGASLVQTDAPRGTPERTREAHCSAQKKGNTPSG